MRKSKILLSGGVLLCLVLAGCGSGGNDSGEEDSGKGNVKDVVENLFEDLDDSQYKALRQTDGQAASDSVTSTGLPQWVEERFKEDMTEEGYASFTGMAFYEIPAKAYEAHKEMDLEDLDIQKDQDTYEISGTLNLESESGADTIDIQGTAQTDDQGLVSYLDISNISEIIENLES